MDCFLLGSGGMMPMPRRRLTSVLVRTDSFDCLFDAGEGVQLSFKAMGLGIKRLSLIAVTHLHADHCLGLPGLLMLRAQVENPGALTIIGPRGLKRFIQNVRADLRCHIPYPVSFIEVDPAAAQSGTALQTANFELQWAALKHSVPCVGFRLQQPHRPGRFLPERARALGVVQGPAWGRLQAGQAVPSAQQQRSIEPHEVMGPPRRGRIMAFVTDTRPCANLNALIAGADIAFVEGMFLPRDQRAAREKGHMTVTEAAAAARQNEVKKLVLVHISPRYSDTQRPELEQAARREFPAAMVGKDLQPFNVAQPQETL